MISSVHRLVMKQWSYKQQVRALKRDQPELRTRPIFRRIVYLALVFRISAFFGVNPDATKNLNQLFAGRKKTCWYFHHQLPFLFPFNNRWVEFVAFCTQALQRSRLWLVHTLLVWVAMHCCPTIWAKWWSYDQHPAIRPNVCLTYAAIWPKSPRGVVKKVERDCYPTFRYFINIYFSPTPIAVRDLIVFCCILQRQTVHKTLC